MTGNNKKANVVTGVRRRKTYERSTANDDRKTVRKVVVGTGGAQRQSKSVGITLARITMMDRD